MGAPWLPRFNWTDDALERVKKLAADGNSAAEIASIIGGGVTRSAIIGKLHRAGLRGGGSPRGGGRSPAPYSRPEGASMPNRARLNGGIPNRILANKERKAAGLDKPQPKIFRLATPGGPVGPIVSLMELNDERCRWPVGDPQHESFGYCGHKTKPESVYCGFHHGIAFISGSSRRNPAGAADGYVCQPIGAL